MTVLRVGGVDDIGLLAPLWIAVHHQHIASMPQLAPYVDDARSWRMGRDLSRVWLERPDTLRIVAEDGGEAVGYGLAHVVDVDDTWIPDTWATGSRIGEIESLSVAAPHRGSGLGPQLLDRLESHLRERGVDDVILGVLPGNADAMRLYERRGYRPTWLYMSRLSGR